MINNAAFRIIGRIGNINAKDKVTHISVASDRQVKEGDSWTTKTDWNTVTLLSEAMRKRLANAKVGKKGNLVIFEGTIQSNSYEKDGEKVYSTSLIAQDFDVLSFAKDSTENGEVNRIKWWPIGHHHLPTAPSLTKEKPMTLQQSLDLAEIEADKAYERFLEAFERDDHPEVIDRLNNESDIARHRYYDALNADLAL
ncbi:single-stranded DNA-binding protein [Labrenzia sp. DG1229]|uniref:single-stranded DNA-binding protein n=1 Tax=Labrenzia sp. DG1229 TaxID=681847 RepID=UPI000690E530|nr:single-stranded DNA-binding protein [Labrenzia sp. DG1229]